MRKTVKILLSVLAVSVLLAACPDGLSSQTAPEGTYATEGLRMTYSSEYLDVTVDGSTGFLSILDKTNGAVWTSNPDGAETDEIAKDRWKTNLKSQFEIMYFNRPTNAIKYTNSYLAATKQSAVKLEQITGGIRMVYDLEELGATIPMDITVKERSVSVKLGFAGQTKRDQFEFLTIRILPFFGAGNARQDGWILVPGGMGGLIRFNNGKTRSGIYGTKIYGNDLAVPDREYTEPEEVARLPVFGIRSGEGSMFAVVEEGAASTEIQAAVNGIVTSYNMVYPSYSLRSLDRYFIRDMTNQEREYIIFDDFPLDQASFALTYHLMDRDAGWSAMADLYRRQIGLEDSATNGDLHLRFLGGTLSKQSFLGFYVDRPVITSTLADVLDVTTDLKQEGITGIRVILEDFTRRSIREKTETDWVLLRASGTPRELAALKDVVGNSNVLYPINNAVVRTTGVFSGLRQARTIAGQSAFRYAFDPETRERIDDSRRKILNPLSVQSLFAKLASKVSPADSILFTATGSTVYSDFGASTSMDRTTDIWAENLRLLKEKGADVSAEGGNAYVLPYVRQVYDAPTTSSRHLMIDQAYPFYPMVLSGSVKYASEPVNAFPDSREQFLRSIQTGSELCFQLMTRERFSDLKNTAYSVYYSADLRLWQADVAHYAREMASLFAMIGPARMIGFETIATGVTRTMYDNDMSVYVNFNSTPYNVDDLQVPAEGYTVKEDERHES
jgi:hypothetical protein